MSVLRSFPADGVKMLTFNGTTDLRKTVVQNPKGDSGKTTFADAAAIALLVVSLFWAMGS